MKVAAEAPAARLVTVATDLFYRKGFRAVGIEEIVDQTGCTKPTLYRHFGSKDGLGAACIQKLVSEDITALAAIGEALPEDPEGQIRAIVRLTVERIANPAYRGWPASNVEVEIPDRDHPARQIGENHKVRVRQHLNQLAREAGFASPSVLADGLLMMMEGAAASSHSFGPGGPSATLVANCDALMGAHRQGARD